MELDYQEIINLIVIILKVALPLGVIFSISEWIITFFLKCAFPWFFNKGGS